MDPQFITHLDTFLFEMQNVTAACSIILFNYLIPIKNSYFNDYQGLSDVSIGNVQVEARHAHLLLLFQSNETYQATLVYQMPFEPLILILSR